MLDDSVLWKMFGPKKKEVTADWRKIHNEERHGF
jgi:hypothetical protein